MSVCMYFYLVSGKVLYSYSSLDKDEVDLTEGDIVTNIKQDESGWWEGEVNTSRGLFPGSYVEIINTSANHGKSSLSYLYLLLGYF